MLSEMAGEFCEGGRLVDGDARGPTGVDLVMADEDGRPLFVDLVGDWAAMIPVRAAEHRRWFKDNARLFLRAYSRDGVVRTEEPVFVFVSDSFPAEVQEVVSALDGLTIRLIRVECYAVDGETELLLEDVTPAMQAAGRRQRAVEPERGVSGTRCEDRIESQQVRELLRLFSSGVDGLDGRVDAIESGDRIRFSVGERALAEVSVSQGSFTVAPGDSLVNPVVVSDRVSLERALNAVVSMFVREGLPAASHEKPAVAHREQELKEEERAELAAIWGAGIPASEN
jgi:hypothetical protein